MTPLKQDSCACRSIRLWTVVDTIMKWKADTKNTQPDPVAKISAYHGIDYLRSFMSLAVIAWHLRLLGETRLF